MSPVVIPFACNEITFPDRPSRRRCPFGTVAGSKLALRSRGTSSRTRPTLVVTVFGYDPLRELPELRPSTAWHLGRPGRYQRRAEIVRCEMSQADLESLPRAVGAMASGVRGAIALDLLDSADPRHWIAAEELVADA